MMFAIDHELGLEMKLLCYKIGLETSAGSFTSWASLILKNTIMLTEVIFLWTIYMMSFCGMTTCSGRRLKYFDSYQFIYIQLLSPSGWGREDHQQNESYSFTSAVMYDMLMYLVLSILNIHHTFTEDKKCHHHAQCILGLKLRCPSDNTLIAF